MGNLGRPVDTELSALKDELAAMHLHDVYKCTLKKSKTRLQHIAAEINREMDVRLKCIVLPEIAFFIRIK